MWYTGAESALCAKRIAAQFSQNDIRYLRLRCGIQAQSQHSASKESLRDFFGMIYVTGV